MTGEGIAKKDPIKDEETNSFIKNDPIKEELKI